MVLIFLTPGIHVGTVLETAQEAAHLKHDALASLMGLSSQRLSHMKAGRENLSLARLLLTLNDDDGRVFFHAFWLLIAEHAGLEDTDALVHELKRFRTAFARLIDKVQPRMVRAQLESAERRKQA